MLISSALFYSFLIPINISSKYEETYTYTLILIKI